MQQGELSPCHPPSPFQQPQELHPSTTLPLGTLLAFIYFNWNFWGCLHRRDLERILLAGTGASEPPDEAGREHSDRYPKASCPPGSWGVGEERC